MNTMKLRQYWVLLVAVMVFAGHGAATFGESADLRAQKDAAKAAIRLGDDAGAENAIIKLKTDFVSNDGLARAINEVAGEYRDTRKFSEACELYEYVLSNWPGDEEALFAQMRLAKVYNQQGNASAVGAAFNKLLSDFQKQEKIDEAVWELGEYFSDYQQYERAGQAYKYVVDNCPGSGHLLEALSGLAKVSIHLGDEATAQAAIKQLQVGFAKDEEIARAVCQIAGCYHLVGQLEKANQLYSYVLSLSGLPKSDEAIIWTQTALALSQMCQKDAAASQKTTDKLCVDFSDNQRIPQALHLIAELCYRDKDYQRAAGIWQEMLEKYHGTSISADQVLYLKGICHENLKEYARAIECYTEIFEDHQAGAFARRVPYQIGKLYRKSGNSSEAINWLERQGKLYPDDVMAEKAMFELGLVYQIDVKDYASAVTAFQKYADNYSTNDHAALALYNAALCYEEMGDVQQAKAVLSQAQKQYPESVFANDIAEQNAKLSGGAK